MKFGPSIWEVASQLIWAAMSLNPKSTRGIATRNKAPGLTVRTSHREEYHCGLSCQNTKHE